jgi:hypothetical protein
MTDSGGIVSGIWERFFAALKKFTEPRWLDINIGGVALTKAASNQPSLVQLNGTSILSYGLGGTSGTNELHGSFELQHDYQEGSDIWPHVHWYPDTSGTGNVILNLDYCIFQDSGNTTGTMAVTTAAPGVAWKEVFSEFGSITGTDLKIGSQIHLRLWRNASATGDTYAGNAAIGTLGIHCIVDFPGSLSKRSK